MVTKTLAIIDVNARGGDLASRAVPSANRYTGMQTLMPWMVQRVGEAKRISQTVVILNGADAKGFGNRVSSGAAVIASDDRSARARILTAADAFGADAVVVLRLDAQLVDPGLIDILVEVAGGEGYDYISYHDDVDVGAATNVGRGIFAEWYRVAAVRESEELDLYRAPERFRVRYLKVSNSADRRHLKVRIDGAAESGRVREFQASEPPRTEGQNPTKAPFFQEADQRRMRSESGFHDGNPRK